MPRPNFLILMVDQLNGTLFPDGPAPFLHTPTLAALAARSTRFTDCYTASPLCAPGRASFMSGALPSQTGVYDNAAEFGSDIPTFAHHLRRAGYFTCLSGKMHFVGPDQLHGFERRLTTDIYPADFGWTPDYRNPDSRIDWWYHNLGSVTGAGPAEISNQMDYDDEVAFHAERMLYDLARGDHGGDHGGDRPWCLTASFTHPHDPYVARSRFWDLYENIPELTPTIGAIPFEAQDPHSQRLMHAADYASFDIRPEHIRRARQGYFANISYLDDKIAGILDVLDRCHLAENTIVLFVSDHGDMLGERGLWFKMSFFEGSARVPLLIAGPGIAPATIRAPVSTIDVTPTLTGLAGIDLGEVEPWTDGESLAPLLAGGARTAPVLMEYAAEGSAAPMVAIRDGRWKYTSCKLDPPQLFDLETDPHEQHDLAADPTHAEIADRFAGQVATRWDLARFDRDVRQSQARRHITYQALRNGAFYPWDFQPLQKASERYMRNHMDLNVLESNRRYPSGE